MKGFQILFWKVEHVDDFFGTKRLFVTDHHGDEYWVTEEDDNGDAKESSDDTLTNCGVVGRVDFEPRYDDADENGANADEHVCEHPEVEEEAGQKPIALVVGNHADKK